MQEILKRLEAKVDQMDQRFSQMDQRFGQMEQRFGQMEQRFGQMEQRFEQMDQRFDKIDQRFDRVDGELHKHGVLLEAMNSDLKQTMETVTGNREVLDNKFAEVLRKLDERVQPVELASRHFARELSAAREGKRTRRKTRP